MPLGQPHTCLIAHQITVIIIRHRQPERPEQKNLPRRRFQQIRPAHDFRDAHGGIVNHDSQLIRRHVVAPPNNKISKVAPRDKPLQSEMQIVKTNLLACPARETANSHRPAENMWRRTPRPSREPRGGAAPVDCSRRTWLEFAPSIDSARPRIHRLIIPLIRRTYRQPYILPRARTRIDRPAFEQTPPCR